jgi:hypothetical protein
MRQHALTKAWVVRIALLGLVTAALVLAMVLGGCTSSGPTPTPTRTVSIIVVTLTPLPPTPAAPTLAAPTPAQPTAEPPTAAPTLGVTVEQPTMPPPTPVSQETVEPYPVLTPTLTPEGYPPPSS